MRLLSGRFVVVTLSALAYFCAIGALVPVIPQYVEDELGGGGLEVGLAVGAFAVSAALLRPAIGRLGDRRGRRVLVTGGALVAALSMAGYVLASSLAVLIVLRLVTGAGEAGLFVGAATAVQDLTPDHRRAEAASYFSVALYGGLSIGPAVGDAVYNASGADAVWLLTAALAALGALLGLWTPVGELVVAPISRRLLHAAAVGPGTVLFLGLCALAGFQAFVPTYVDDIGVSSSGPVFALYGVTILCFRVLGARVPDRMGSVRAATVALVAVTAGMGVLGLWRAPAGLYTGTVLYSIGMAFLFPALFALVVATAPPQERSHAVGTFSLFFDLAQGLGAALLGVVVVLGGEPAAFLAAGIVAAIGLVRLHTLSLAPLVRSGAGDSQT